MYVQHTLPPVRQYEMEFNRKLLTPEARQRGLYWKFNSNAFLRGDMKTRGEFYLKGVIIHDVHPNEIRMEELPPDAWRREAYLERRSYPLTNLAKGSDNLMSQVKKYWDIKAMADGVADVFVYGEISAVNGRILI